MTKTKTRTRTGPAEWSLDELRDRLERAERRADEAIAAIPPAILAGDESALKRLRSDRAEACTEASDLSEALELVREREEGVDVEAAASARAESLGEARELAGLWMASAEEIDLLLVGLESAVSSYERLGEEMGGKIRLAGVPEVSMRVKNSLLRSLRYAVALSAPRAADLMQVPRVPAHHRRGVAQSTSDLLRGLFGDGSKDKERARR